MIDLSEVLDRDYGAWVNADNPEKALRTWPRVTLEATNSGSRTRGPNRRGRAAQINALKRAIERALPGTKLVLESRVYSETWGFTHKSEFTYRIDRKD